MLDGGGRSTAAFYWLEFNYGGFGMAGFGSVPREHCLVLFFYFLIVVWMDRYMRLYTCTWFVVFFILGCMELE